MSLIFLITGAIAIISLIYFYFIECFKFFEKRNIPIIPPSFPMGHLYDVGKTVHIAERIKEIYDKFKKNHKASGLFLLATPRIIPIDLDFIKEILIKDFQKFRNRGIFHDESYDPLSGHLFNLHDGKWSELRKKLSPTFTSGKMKMMFPIISNKTENLLKFVEKNADNKEPLDIKDVCVRYTADVIAICAFGLDCNCLSSNQNDDFMTEALLFFDYKNPKRQFGMFIQNSFPKFARLIKSRTVLQRSEEYFTKLISDAVEYRKKNPGNYNDFLNLLINIYEHGIVKGEKDENVGTMTFNQMVAQAFLFLVAGFETTSTGMHFTLYELAKNQDIQQRARDEIKTILKKYDGKMTYDAVMELNYLQQVIDESLRRYSPVWGVFREFNEDYKIPDTEITIPKGTGITIPVQAIHMDADIYPEPEIFDPERFTPENKKLRHPCAFIPFGDGPRNCIGMRFAILETRLGIAELLLRYKFSVNDKTDKNPVIDPRTFVVTIENGLWLNVEKI